MGLHVRSVHLSVRRDVALQRCIPLSWDTTPISAFLASTTLFCFLLDSRLPFPTRLLSCQTQRATRLFFRKRKNDDHQVKSSCVMCSVKQRSKC